MKRMLTLILLLVLPLGLGCTTTHTDCIAMCHDEGKTMKVYESALFAVRCECTEPSGGKAVEPNP